MPTIDGLLLDMNGLFRHWHNTGAQTSEQRAGLPAGAIARYAYDHPSYRLARVGVITDQQWADDVAERLAKDYGPAVREHLAAWRSDRGEPDSTMVELLRQMREHVPVGVLSNCTDALPADLDHHNIEFDFVFASAHLGVDKPSPLAFRAAAEHMGLPPTKLGYFDDEPTFVRAAKSVGMQAQLFETAETFASHLRSFGLPVKCEKHGNQ
ncbi:HAD-IA family hydrolase [Streptomyces sp. NPDC037389]|uniref:HAD family hydrolase n=1 Tax=Streptomyces sp. NPDC037389 TaxID=3155369 RepID=UPI0033C20C9E